MSGSWGSLLGELTALAAVVAFSPFSVIPAIALVVHSARPKPTALAFVAGWLTGKAAITVVFVQVPRLLDSLQGTPPHWTSWARIAAGVLVIAAGIWDWRKPPQAVESPKWLERLKTITPLGAAAAGVALTLVNPKVLLMCAAAGLAIGSAQLSVLGATGAVAYFTAVGGSSAAIPILAYAVWAHRVDPYLDRFKNWMERRQVLITAVVLILLGLVLIVTGIRAV